ncbi:MAG: PEP-CTERM sorting domain-containing protein [Hahellaceae bacterium]|nr:PEP-CTERM sorting domain-containing protein [Hahellaceae bacterium]
MNIQTLIISIVAIVTPVTSFAVTTTTVPVPSPSVLALFGIAGVSLYLSKRKSK